MLSLEAFGLRIRNLRIEKNLTQQQLADRMFVSRKTIGNWEYGRRLPHVTMLSRLARNLGVETYELLNELYDADEPPIVLMVDNEPAILKVFVQFLSELLPEAQVYGFDAMSEALCFAADNRIGVVFINLEQLKETGLLFAKTLTDIAPKANIIFLARNLEHADEAWKLHASGYVLMPLTAEKLQHEIRNLRYSVPGLP